MSAGKEEMMTTKTEKTNPDYSKTAVNLCNPEEVKALLTRRWGLREQVTLMGKALEAEAQYRNLVNTQAELVELDKQIREAIEQHGSYQDIEVGVYAVKYAKHSKEYHVDGFKRNYPDFVPSVVTEAINVKVLEGLVKGKLITEDALRLNKVVTETETFAFYIR